MKGTEQRRQITTWEMEQVSSRKKAREQSKGAWSSVRWGECSRIRGECCRYRGAKNYRRAT